MTDKLFEKKQYLPRLVDQKIKDSLEVIGGIFLVGPRYCGKTWTGINFTKSQINILKDNLDNVFDLNNALQGKTPRLIDEWQIRPEIWNAVVNEISIRGKSGQYILTGSILSNWDKIQHSGVGRIGMLNMYTLSLSEMNLSTKEVSLSKLLNECKLETKTLNSPFTYHDIAQIAWKGGWPSLIDNNSNSQVQIWLDYYINNIMNLDEWYFKARKIDFDKYNLFLKSLARNEGQTIKLSTIANDINNVTKIDTRTIDNYLNIVSKLFIIEKQESYIPNYLSSKKVLNTAKMRFIDPSIPINILGLTPESLVENPNMLGVFFESLVIRDLRVYGQLFNWNILHYRDKWSNEVDCILQLRNGDFAAIEIKLSNSYEEQAATSLLKFKKEMEEEQKLAKNNREKMYKKVPKWLIIISGTAQKAYQREDGIFVIPYKMLCE